MDSIGGFLNLPKSLASETAKNLPEIAFSEMSRPALRTATILQELQASLDQNRPSIAVMMVGKSDYATSLSQLPSWFLQLRVTKFADLLGTDLYRHYVSAVGGVLYDTPEKAQFAKAWLRFSKRDFDGALPLFEDALRLFPDSEREIRALQFSYASTGKFLKGSYFLSSLEASPEFKALANSCAHELEIMSGELDENRKTRKIQELKNLASVDPNSRNAFRTSLWAHKAADEKTEFENELKNIRPEQSTPISGVTANLLNRIADRILERGIRLIVLQYPTDRGDELRHALSLNANRIEIVDTREWMLASSKSERVSDMIAIDIEHLTEQGATLVAENLAKLILTIPSSK